MEDQGFETPCPRAEVCALCGVTEAEVTSVLGCHSQRKKRLCRTFCGVQLVLSETRAEPDFCNSVVFFEM